MDRPAGILMLITKVQTCRLFMHDWVGPVNRVTPEDRRWLTEVACSNMVKSGWVYIYTTPCRQLIATITSNGFRLCEQGACVEYMC
jgi:hypothetical protein